MNFSAISSPLLIICGIIIIVCLHDEEQSANYIIDTSKYVRLISIDTLALYFYPVMFILFIVGSTIFLLLEDRPVRPPASAPVL